MVLSKSSLSLQVLGQHGRSLLHLPLSPSPSSHCNDSESETAATAIVNSRHKHSESEPDIIASASVLYELLPTHPPPLDKRRSRLGFLTTLIPSLISQPADTPGPPQPQAITRKPVPAKSPSPPAAAPATKPSSPSPAVDCNTTQKSPEPKSPDSLPPPSDSGFDFSFDIPAARPAPTSDSYIPSPMLRKPSPPSQHIAANVTTSDHPVEATPVADIAAQISPPAPTTPPPPIPSNSRDRTPPRNPDIQLTKTAPSPTTKRSSNESKLSKAPKESRRSRSSSIQALASQKLRLATGDRVASPDGRLRSSSAQPPTRRPVGPDQARVVSTGSRPVSTYSSDDTGSPHRGKVRKSFFPGGRSRSNSQDIPRIHNSPAWIISDGSHAEYSTTYLLNSDRVPELWNETADVYVHLHPRETGCAPSFKVPSSVIFSSKLFMDQIREVALTPTSGTRSRGRSFGGRDSLTAEDATRVQTPPLPGTESPGEYRIYIPHTPDAPKPTSFTPGPPSKPDMERLIAVRNLFAFLTGQKLVGTKVSPTIFSAFIAISHLLKEFEFNSSDGGTYGEIPDVSFSWYLSQIPLADVRYSREKTLEALVLAEAMRSQELFSEAFAHAVGKWAAIKDTKSPLLNMLSENAKKKLERGDLDLAQRQAVVNNKLEQFDFPALFAGIASSVTAGKEVKFARWKTSFMKMRSFVLGYYKSTLGSWPPRASSKKNPFSESGLNRQVLRILYSDFCALYDLLVDRESLTPRVGEMSNLAVEDNTSGDSMDNSTAIYYLRKILDEYDTSTPPVLPPIPFDIPMLPAMTSVYKTYSSMSTKEQLSFDKKIQPHELLLVLSKAYNIDTYSLDVPFLEQFKEFESKEARGGKPLAEIVDQRIGYWLFLYAVIQTLPNLVVDCPDLKYTEGVEYFLCQPHMGALPWVEEPTNNKILFQVANGAIVELPADSVAFSVEAVYHRSHCWLSGKIWEEALHMGPGEAGGLPPPKPATQEFVGSSLEPPNPGFADMDSSGHSPHSRSPSLPPTGGSSPSAGSPPYALRPRNQSPVPRGRTSNRVNHHYRSSIALGIEPLALPEGFGDSRRSRVVSTNFDSLTSLGPTTSGGLRGSVSHGNLQQLLAESPPHSESPTKEQVRDGSSSHTPGHRKGQGSQGGSTFDDILGKVDKKEKKSKKWVLF